MYSDMIHVVDKLTDDQAGKLLKAVLMFTNDQQANLDDFVVEIAFEPIKQQLKRDLQKYNERAKRSRSNGSQGGRPKNSNNPEEPSGLFVNPEEPTGLRGQHVKPRKPVNGNGNGNGNANDTVTDTVTDTVNVNEKKKIRKDLSDKKKLSDSLYPKFISVYNDFCKTNTGGVGAKIDGAEGKAMKTIITYLKNQSTDKTEQGGLNGFNYILDNWYKLEPFLKDKIKLSQINSNIINILKQIKHGSSKKTTKLSASTFDRDINNITDYGSLEPDFKRRTD